MSGGMAAIGNDRFGKVVPARLVMFALHLAIYFLLLYGYEHHIVPLYGSEGFYFEPSKAKFSLSLGLAILLSLLTPVDDERPSALFLQVALMFVLIPMLVIFYAEDKPWVYTLQAVTAYCVVLLVLPLLKGWYLRLPSLKNREMMFLLTFLSALFVGMVFAMGGGSNFNLDISKVYDFREIVEEDMPGIFGYVSPLIGKVLLPFALLLALLLKKRFHVLLCMTLSVLVFGLTSHKGPLFYPLFIVVVYYLMARKNFIRNFSLVIISVLCLSIVDFALKDVYDHFLYGWFGSLTMRRMFIVPASVNYMYYDFFSANDFVLWSNSKFTFNFLNYPYSLDPSHLIGLEYFDSDLAGVNTGWLGSGYMQAGFPSMIVYGLIITAVFSYIDKLASIVEDKRLVVAGTFIPVITLIISSDLPVSFLTHGFLANLLMIGFLRRKEKEERQSAACAG